MNRSPYVAFGSIASVGNVPGTSASPPTPDVSLRRAEPTLAAINAPVRLRHSGRHMRSCLPSAVNRRFSSARDIRLP